MNSLNDLVRDESMEEKANCPIEWCTSSVRNHGGDGEPAEHWEHDGEFRELEHFESFVVTISETQIGSGPISLTILADLEGEYSSEQLRLLSKDLAALSTAVLAESARIDALNGVTA